MILKTLKSSLHTNKLFSKSAKGHRAVSAKPNANYTEQILRPLQYLVSRSLASSTISWHPWFSRNWDDSGELGPATNARTTVLGQPNANIA